ncbi:MAG TPA: c-type cytochrome [Solirubrobacteraceae bacterium]|jgi:mono/diheme cytochrome c family protein
MARAPIAAILLSALAISGCGGSGGAQPNGQALFSQACSACHSLTGVESPKRQGGDLRAGRFSRAVMLQFAREMPVRRRLSEAELRRVADYVVSVERANR